MFKKTNDHGSKTSLLSMAVLSAVMLTACSDQTGQGTGHHPQVEPKTDRAVGSPGRTSEDIRSSASSGEPAIDDASISTALFERMLTTQTAYIRAGSLTFGIAKFFRAEETTSNMPDPNRAWAQGAARKPDMYSYQLPAKGKFVVRVWGSPVSPDGSPAASSRAVESYAHFGYKTYSENEQPDKRLSILTNAELKTHLVQDDGGRTSYRDTSSLKAHDVKDIPRNARLRFDEYLYSWKGVSDNSSMSLHLYKGDSPDEVALCLKTYSAYGQGDPTEPYVSRGDVQRRTCSLWKVPSGWTEEQPLLYQGIFVYEDYSDEDHVPSEFMEAYWKTRPFEDLIRDATAGSQGRVATFMNGQKLSASSRDSLQKLSSELNSRTDGIPLESISSGTQDTDALEQEASFAQHSDPVGSNPKAR